MAATCILCPVYRPDNPPRQPDRPPVCEGDRRRIGFDLADIDRLHSRLVNPDPVEYNGRWYPANYDTFDSGSKAWVRHWETRRADPLAALGGAGPTAGRDNQPRVSGTRAPSVPISVDDIDLTGPARQPVPTEWARQYPGDQIGHLSVATRLEEVVRDWRDTLWPNQHLPISTVPELVAWMRAGATDTWAGPRVDEACDRHPAIADTAAELKEIRRVLRSAAGEADPPPRRWLGLTCRGCAKTSLIAREEGEVFATCGGCGLMYSDKDLTESLRKAVWRAPQETST